jgi:hypothetical protein
MMELLEKLIAASFDTNDMSLIYEFLVNGTPGVFISGNEYFVFQNIQKCNNYHKSR